MARLRRRARADRSQLGSGLADGGFITTNFLPRGGTREATQRMMGGERNGELWEWHTASGWQKVPGSEAAGANGVELSDDGKTLYVAAWGSQSFFRVSRGATPPTRDEIPLGFRVDNIHWARDGSLYRRRVRPARAGKP